MSGDLILAFDVGGTRIKAGVVDGDGRVVRRSHLRTHGERGIRPVLESMISEGYALLGDQADRLVRVGVSFTGVIDPTRGVVVHLNGKFPDVEGFDVSDPLRREFGVPVHVDNDGRCYTAGEWRHGAGQGVDNIVCITIGTGVGSGVVIGGRLFRTGGLIGGILAGHFTVDADGDVCSCGNVGCAEMRSSVTALVRNANDRIGPERGAERSLSGEDVLDAAATDPLARDIVDHWCRSIGATIVNLIHAYDPDMVVIGGGIMTRQDVILPPVRHYVSEHAWTCPPGRTQIEAGALGDDAALIGAAFLRSPSTDDSECR